MQSAVDGVAEALGRKRGVKVDQHKACEGRDQRY